MTVRSFLYAVPDEAASGLLRRRGAASEIIVRRMGVGDHAQDMVGSTLIVLSVLRNAPVIALVGEVARLAIIESDALKGDYVVEFNPERCIQTTTVDNAQKWLLEGLEIGEMTVVECSESILKQIRERLLHGWVVRSSKQPPFVSGTRETVKLSGGLIRQAVVEVLRSMPLDECQKHFRDGMLSPIGSESLRRLEVGRQGNLKQMEDQLGDVDPLVQLGWLGSGNAFSRREREVDCFLREVRPTDIMDRTYVSSEPSIPSLPFMTKIERGERLHQLAVRKLVQGCIDQNVIPTISSSIDLAWVVGDVQVLVEVKSVNEDNLESQIIAAVGQVLFYESEWKRMMSSPQVRSNVITYCESELALPDSCIRLAARAGLGLFHITPERATAQALSQLVRGISDSAAEVRS